MQEYIGSDLHVLTVGRIVGLFVGRGVGERVGRLDGLFGFGLVLRLVCIETEKLGRVSNLD